LTYSYKLYNSIHEVDLEQWKKVCLESKSNIFMDFKFLSTFEETMAECSKFWYVIFFDNNENPIACTSLSTFQADLTIVANKTTKQIINNFRKSLPSLLYFKVLFCGLPISIGQEYICFQKNANHQLIIKLLDSLMNTIALREKARLIIYKEFDADKSSLLDVLMDLGYSRGNSLPMHYFQPNFSDFNDYCAALKFKYRKNIKLSRNKFENSDLRTVYVKDTDKILQMYTEEVHHLYEAVVQKSEHQLELLPASFFRRLAKSFSGQLIFTLAYKGEKIVAFICSLHNQSNFYFLFCGVDYSLNTESDLYFNLMYDTLNEALKHKVSSIELGQTADTFKARLGCNQKPLFLYTKGVGFPINLFVRHSFNTLFPKPPEVPTNDIYKQTNISKNTLVDYVESL
jgi:predicted N-acyltransferase